MRFPFGLSPALFWICAVAAMLAQVALLRSAFVPRSDVAPDRAVPVSSSRFAELAWSVLPALSLVATFVWAWTLLGPAGGAP